MSNIEQNLAFILSSRYGEDVRQAIHDSIHDCYEDGKAGSIDLVAREQIANLVANEGNTSKDSELVDVRVGADGFTYESAGLSVRNQFDIVNNGMSNRIELSYTNIGHYIAKATGNLVANSGWCCTDYINVVNYEQISIKAELVANDLVANIAFFTPDKRILISYVNAEEAIVHLLDHIEVPENAAFMVISTEAVKSDSEVILYVLDKKNKLYEQLNLEFYTGYYSNDGRLVKGNLDWRYSDKIFVNKELRLLFCPTFNQNVSTIAFFDSGDNFLSGIVKPDGTLGCFYEEISLPKGCAYARISMLQTDVDYDIFAFIKNEKSQNILLASELILPNCRNSIYPGEYEANILIPSLCTELISLGNKGVRIKKNVQDYDHPVLFIGAGTVKGFVFEADELVGGYIIHSENKVAKCGLLFEDCVFKYNGLTPANLVGAGMYPGETLTFKNCIFISSSDGSVAYIHDNTTLTGEYTLEFLDCTFINRNNYILAFTSYAKSGSKINMRFINNFFKGTLGTTSPYIATGNNSAATADVGDLGLRGWYLTEDSRGNTLSELNK